MEMRSENENIAEVYLYAVAFPSLSRSEDRAEAACTNGKVGQSSVYFRYDDRHPDDQSLN